MAIAGQAVLLTPVHRLPRTFPQPKAKVVYMRTAPRYSGGTVPAFNRLPY